MKKASLKILGTIFAIIAVFIGQYYIRKYYNIDPRIWFIVLYVIGIVTIFIIYAIFNSEIKKIKQYSFSELMADIKKVTERILENLVYQLLDSIIKLVGVAGILYKIFFNDDFMSRTILYIVFLIIMVYMSLSSLVKVMLKKENYKVNDAYLAVMYGLLFIMYLIDFTV